MKKNYNIKRKKIGIFLTVIILISLLNFVLLTTSYAKMNFVATKVKHNNEYQQQNQQQENQLGNKLGNKISATQLNNKKTTGINSDVKKAEKQITELKIKIKKAYKECLKKQSKKVCDKILKASEVELNKKLKKLKEINKKIIHLNNQKKKINQQVLNVYKKIRKDKTISNLVLSHKLNKNKNKQILILRNKINRRIQENLKQEHKIRDLFRKKIKRFNSIKLHFRKCSRFNGTLNEECKKINQELLQTAKDILLFNINLTIKNLENRKLKLNITKVFTEYEKIQKQQKFNEIIQKLEALYSEIKDKQNITKEDILNYKNELKSILKEIARENLKLRYLSELREVGLILHRLNNLQLRIAKFQENNSVDESTQELINEFNSIVSDSANEYDKLKQYIDETLNSNETQSEQRKQIHKKILETKRNMIKQFRKANKLVISIIHNIRKHKRKLPSVNPDTVALQLNSGMNNESQNSENSENNSESSENTVNNFNKSSQTNTNQSVVS